MSGPSRRNEAPESEARVSLPKLPMIKATLEFDLTEPALAWAAFDMMRVHAAYHGLEDIESIRVNVSVDVKGRTAAHEVDALKTRLDQLWSGYVTSVEIDGAKQ